MLKERRAINGASFWPEMAIAIGSHEWVFAADWWESKVSEKLVRDPWIMAGNWLVLSTVDHWFVLPPMQSIVNWPRTSSADMLSRASRPSKQKLKLHYLKFKFYSYLFTWYFAYRIVNSVTQAYKPKWAPLAAGKRNKQRTWYIIMADERAAMTRTPLRAWWDPVGCRRNIRQVTTRALPRSG
jgi:hypothetical protein